MHSFKTVLFGPLALPTGFFTRPVPSLRGRVPLRVLQLPSVSASHFQRLGLNLTPRRRILVLQVLAWL